MYLRDMVIILKAEAEGLNAMLPEVSHLGSVGTILDVDFSIYKVGSYSTSSG